MSPLLSGIDRLLLQPPAWRTSRIALVTNHAATTNRFESSLAALVRAGFNIVALFSPEHGLDATAADGHRMQHGVDPLTGIPVISLYGDRLAPAPDDLKDIELVLFDVPDIGCRFYTYLWTLTHVMEACAASQVPLVIADRPNPLSGDPALSEGPMLDEDSCGSFIGRWSIPVRHSCSLGELALYFNASRGIGCPLEVIPCLYWKRSMYYPDFCPSFVPTSPAITSFEGALLYPGLCFLEATNISEGRGTAVPFRVAGAPWMQSERTAELFNDLIAFSGSTNAAGADAAGANVAGRAGSVYARPVNFTPLEGKYAGQPCNGVMLHVIDPHAFRPVAAGWLLIKVIRDLHPGLFQWAPYPTHVNPSGRKHLDLLAGLPDTEQFFETRRTGFLREMEKKLSVGQWQDQVRPFLLYA